MNARLYSHRDCPRCGARDCQRCRQTVATSATVIVATVPYVQPVPCASMMQDPSLRAMPRWVPVLGAVMAVTLFALALFCG
jgi:hypothetical protein